MNTKELRETWDVSQKALAVITGAPLRTIQGWDTKNTLKAWELVCIESRLKEVLDWYCNEQEEWYMKHIKPFKDFNQWVLDSADRL